MDQGGVLIVNLSKGELGVDSSNILGGLLVATLGLAALSRADAPADQRPPLFLYVDEFQSFTTLAFAEMMAELRKYGLGLTLAHQHFHQLDPDIRHAVLGNAGTLIAFRVGAEDAPLLAAEFQPVFGVVDLLNLPNRHCYLKLMIDGTPNRAAISRAHSEFCLYLRECGINRQVGDLHLRLLTYLDQVLGSTADLYSKYTGYQCAACVKIFSRDPHSPQPPQPTDPGNPPHVFTLRRDITSALTRRLVDSLYPVYRYSDNAAFRAILDDHKRPDFFFCNNLIGLGDGYFSANENYQKYYNATIVVPVQRHGLPVNQRCTALLCVDNMKGGFDNDRCIHILNGIAMDVYYALWTTSWLLTLDDPPKEPSHAD
ncbi:MAG: type IV secretory system conjugative DNA transfer family protein [Candidatus Pacebacteria bacterium]|nr:type IV secretory system conjugative DNA transfer family protein [Candidatus Paceibacterota bacterium]